jgi:hypothetical protein
MTRYLIFGTVRLALLLVGASPAPPWQWRWSHCAASFDVSVVLAGWGNRTSFSSR